MKRLTQIFRRPRQSVANGSRRTSERGSSLILALVYIVSVSLIVGALADWAMNDLNNTTHFQNASSVDNAVSGATEVAIQSIRYYPQSATLTSVANCGTPPSGSASFTVTVNRDLVAVWCSTSQHLQSPNTRIVTFLACPVTTALVAAGTALGKCQSGLLQPSLTAQVTFDDYPSGGGGLLQATCSGGPGVCGFAATTNQWTWS